jgi:hypothetical protein
MSAAPDSPRAAPVGLAESFVAEVARRNLVGWLPKEPATILDLSIRCPHLTAAMLDGGHRVLYGDCRALDWVEDTSVDVVVAEGGALSRALAAELALDDLHRVLRPRGQLLLCVDSLVAGLSRLADQGRWAELADAPSADVVLVPTDDGSVARCFWPEELHDMLVDAGFDVDWVRPRTVLAEQAVTRALTVDPTRMSSLVSTELALERQRQGESIGARLVASARRPA